MAIDWGTIAKVGATLASNYANSRNQQRQQAQGNAQVQNQQALQQNAQQNNVALQLALLDLQRRQQTEQNRGTRASQAVRGDLISNVQDASVQAGSHIPRLNISGGLRPSALGGKARMAGDEMSRQALLAMLQGDQFAPVGLAGPIDLNANQPRESTFDKIMAGIGTAGNIWQAYGAARQPQTATSGASSPQAVQLQSIWDRFMQNTGSGMSMPNTMGAR